MPTRHDHDVENQHRVRRPENRTAEPHAASASPLAYSPTLLNASRLGGRGNASVQTATLLQMQQTYGNRATQQFLQRSANSSSASSYVQQAGAKNTDQTSVQSVPAATPMLPVQRQVRANSPFRKCGFGRGFKPVPVRKPAYIRDALEKADGEFLESYEIAADKVHIQWNNDPIPTSEGLFYYAWRVPTVPKDEDVRTARREARQLIRRGKSRRLRRTDEGKRLVRRGMRLLRKNKLPEQSGFILATEINLSDRELKNRRKQELRKCRRKKGGKTVYRTRNKACNSNGITYKVKSGYRGGMSGREAGLLKVPRHSDTGCLGISPYMVKDNGHIILTWNLPDQKGGGAVITILQPHDVFNACGLEKSLDIYRTSCKEKCNVRRRVRCKPPAPSIGKATWLYGYVTQGTKARSFYGWVLKEARGVPQMVQTTSGG